MIDRNGNNLQIGDYVEFFYFNESTIGKVINLDETIARANLRNVQVKVNNKLLGWMKCRNLKKVSAEKEMIFILEEL